MRALARWPRRHPMLTLLIALALVGAAVAAVVLRQDVTTNPAAVAPDVVFASGSDYVAINAAGFATLTLGSSATSATLAVNGIPGAADLQITNLLNVTNQDATQAYTVTLQRSTTLHASISSFVVHVKTAGGSTVVDWNAKTDASATPFNLPASTTYVISIDILIADGTSVGGLGTFGMQFQLVPV
jgi:hypothetical protein